LFLLISTNLGAKIFEFSQKNFSRFLNETTTKELEEKMDQIENGEKNYEDVLREIYIEVKEIIKSNIEKGVKYPNISLDFVFT
jgi:reverse gyrase